MGKSLLNKLGSVVVPAILAGATLFSGIDVEAKNLRKSSFNKTAYSVPVQPSAVTVSDIYTHTNVVKDANFVPPTGDRAVYYNCNNVTFNGRTPEHKMILLYAKQLSPTSATTRIVGGLTVYPRESLVTNGYMNSTAGTSTIGMFSGETPTNGLNGGSYWVAGNDLNDNGKVGTYTFDSGTGAWTINFEAGESVGIGNTTNGIKFASMPSFPSTGTGPATILANTNSGYQNLNGNDVPDFYEDKYGLIGRPNGNDEDHDGQTDKQEWIAGTDPTNNFSFFPGPDQTLALRQDGPFDYTYTNEVGQVTNGQYFVYHSTGMVYSTLADNVPGRNYTLQRSADLKNGTWQGIPAYTNIPAGSSNLHYLVDFSVDTSQKQFFRRQVELDENEKINP